MQNVQPEQLAVGPEPGPAALAPDFEAWLTHAQRQVEDALSAHLVALEAELAPHSPLPAAVLYSVRVGGKRLRPILVIEACRLCGGETAHALPAALALELVHTFSLIHDDLPAMDNDDLRRGQPTNHKVFGEAQAILAGDWLVTHAFALLVAGGTDSRVAGALVRILADGTQRMIAGQAADVAGEGRPPSGDLVRFIHLHKTAALIETACELGATCAGAAATDAAALARYGRHLGLAFQITDDLLDETGSAARLGKSVGKDAAVAKQTYPAVFGQSESLAQARHEIDAALAALEPFGPRADRLRDLARFVVRRDY